MELPPDATGRQLLTHSLFRETIIFPVAVMFGDIIDILVAAAAAANQDRPGFHLFGQFHRVSDGMGAFQRRNDPFVTR